MRRAKRTRSAADRRGRCSADLQACIRRLLAALKGCATLQASMSVSERTWITAGLPSGAYEALTRELPASRLWSLLLEVVDARAAARRPASLMEQWDRDRFVGLAAVDQRAQLEVDRHLLDAASAFESIELSPVAPLGVCSSMGRASQSAFGAARHGSRRRSDQRHGAGVCA